MSGRLVRPTTANLSLEEVIRLAARHDDVEGIVLLGSTATGELSAVSDYDIMIVLTAGNEFTVEVTAVDGRLTDVVVINLALLDRAPAY